MLDEISPPLGLVPLESHAGMQRAAYMAASRWRASSAARALLIAFLQPLHVRKPREVRRGRAQGQPRFAHAVAEMVAVSGILVWLLAAYRSTAASGSNLRASATSARASSAWPS